MKGRRAKIIYNFLYAGMTGLFLLLSPPPARAQESIESRIMIKVNPNIIVLPENVEIAKVPISAVRIRSTELRELNKKYNATSIERLFKVRQKPDAKQILRAKGSRDTTGAESIDSSKVFTRRQRNELIKKGQIDEDKEVAEARDVFLVSFELGVQAPVSADNIADEYRTLSVVQLAERVQ